MFIRTSIINEYLNHFWFEMLISGSKRNLYNTWVRENFYIYIIYIWSVKSKTNTKTDKRRSENSLDVVLQLPHSIADIPDSENSQSQSSLEMYSLNIEETQDETIVVERINTIKEGLYNR